MQSKSTLKINEIKKRDPALMKRLLNLWENSVKATHWFLSPAEINSIKPYAQQGLNGIPLLIIAENEKGKPTAFLGIANNTLEMIFVRNENRGQGLGKLLLRYAMENYAVNYLTVNEENSLARGFYEHMGFKVYKPTDLDEQGNPYPLLYMKREG